MLNLSHNRIDKKVDKKLYRSFSMLKDYKASKQFERILIIMFILILVVLFLPWTQNVRSRGFITTLDPDQRPQMIHSIIGGRIEKWYVREGNYVTKGDTILFLSEIKDEYFDPHLLQRTKDQINAKGLSAGSYKDKVRSLEGQVNALQKTRILKLEQARNYVRQAELKIQSDSMDLKAASINLDVAQHQLERMEQLYKEGLKSLTDLEVRKLKLQETHAKKISAENKLLTSKNELINAKVELGSIENQYQDKLSKAESEKYEALSGRYETEAMITKMENQYSNYSLRSELYYKAIL